MAHSPNERLDSWKEIAAFLNRTVRTAQRWERTEGLPVHRHRHAALGSVYAVRSELTRWWASRSVSPATISPEPAHALSAPDSCRLLVLPFLNLSGDSTQEFLADGFTEELITQLAGLQPDRLAVIARTTAMHYKRQQKSLDRIARELSLDYVLQGSLRREANTLRISAQLISVADQTHLWTHTYDRDLGSAFSIQREVTEAIANAIHLALPSPMSTRGSRTANPLAYESHLMGRFHLHRMTVGGLREAVQAFNTAITHDPDFAIAHADLSHAYALLATVPFDALPPAEVMPRAKRAAKRALAINDALAEAHFSHAVVLHHYDWNWSEAEQSYRRALQLQPDFSRARLQYAWLLLAHARNTDALHQIELAHHSARETDPRTLVVTIATRAAAYYFCRDFDRCIAESQAGLALDSHYFLLRYLLARAHIRKGELNKATLVLKLAKLDDSIPLMAMGRALLAAVTGHKKDTRAALAALLKSTKKRYIPATYIGILHAGLGDADSAFQWLECAYQERADGLTLLNVDPMVDGIRSDARFAPLARRLGLLK